MPAPRCPTIHKLPEEWAEWAMRYILYKKGEIPYIIPFSKFRGMRLVRHLGDLEIDRTWKYYLYLTLTKRKHRTLIASI